LVDRRDRNASISVRDNGQSSRLEDAAPLLVRHCCAPCLKYEFSCSQHLYFILGKAPIEQDQTILMNVGEII
jgi:hypothetical protein